MSEELATVNLLVSMLGTLFTGVAALIALGERKVTAKIACPNCGQPFDISDFPRVDGKRLVTCPRCTYTFEA